MKVLSDTGLTELVTKVKAWVRNNFIGTEQKQQTTILSIDSTPTTGSTNLVTSGGVRAAIDAGGGGYTLPTASASTLGGIKVGTNLSINSETGVLSATDTKYTLPVATSSALGGVKSGTDITVDGSGNVSVVDDSHNHIISNIDNLQSTLDAKMPKSGGTFTGSVTLNGNPSSNLQAATKQYVDAIESYSTTEVATGGTWIDGKTIYKITIKKNNPTRDSSNYMLVGNIGAVSSIVKIDCVLNLSALGYTQNEVVCAMVEPSGQVGLFYTFESATFNYITATVYYTKN